MESINNNNINLQQKIRFQPGIGGYLPFDDDSYITVGENCKERLLVGTLSTKLSLTKNALALKRNQFINDKMEKDFNLYHNHMKTVISNKVVNLFKPLFVNNNDFDTFKQACTKDQVSVISGLHYIPLPTNMKSSFAAHKDVGVFALISHRNYSNSDTTKQDSINVSTGSLEVYINGKWQFVNPKPNCMFFIVGRVLEYWTNGCFRATLHRVRNLSNHDKYSLVYFNNCNENAKFELYFPIKCMTSIMANKYNNIIDDENYLRVLKQNRLKKLFQDYHDVEWYQPQLNLSSVDFMCIVMKLIQVPKPKHSTNIVSKL